ncbi:MAG: saccharopine dehydrogenase NADP-binding domain-containing protein [Burkholderiales bacterium]|nr:saccharopine dehydrogenase NADP-binding domain-containing protein [Burkholderiales bacterium]
MNFEKYAKMNGNILIIGFGSIGPAVLPLIIRHVDIDKHQISIIAADKNHKQLAQEYGINFECITLNEQNYTEILTSRLKAGDLLLNLAVDVSSYDLILLCHQLKVLYLDTSIERWKDDKHITESLYERRSKLMKHKKALNNDVTALVCNGANPGLISHIAKQAVLDVAQKITGNLPNIPATQQEWAQLVKDLDIVTLHIAERDTQLGSSGRRADEYVNTWSVTGLLDESLEYTGFSWGTHETELPNQLVKTQGETNTYRFIQLASTGANTKVKSWIASHGIYHGFVIPHTEAFSLAEYFCHIDAATGQVSHPTVHYVYQPCNDALVSLHDAAAKNQANPDKIRLLHEDIIEGYDELGILVLRKGSPHVYWLGSKLSIHEARRLADNNNATSLQVAIGVLVGIVHVINNPKQGLIEAEQCDFAYALKIANPYLGDFSGHWGTWTENNDYSWTFANLSVNLIGTI